MKKAISLAFSFLTLSASAQVSVHPIDLELARRLPALNQPFQPTSGSVHGYSAAYAPSVQVSFPVAARWTVSAGLGHVRRYTSTAFSASVSEVRQAIGSSAPVPEKGILTDVTTRDYYLSVPLGLFYTPRIAARARGIVGLQLRGDIRTAGRQTADFLPERFASTTLDVPRLKQDVEAYFARQATPFLLSVAPTLGFDAPLSPRLALVMTARATWYPNAPDRVAGGFAWGLGGQAGLRISLNRRP